MKRLIPILLVLLMLCFAFSAPAETLNVSEAVLHEDAALWLQADLTGYSFAPLEIPGAYRLSPPQPQTQWGFTVFYNTDGTLRQLCRDDTPSETATVNADYSFEVFTTRYDLEALGLVPLVVIQKYGPSEGSETYGFDILDEAPILIARTTLELPRIPKNRIVSIAWDPVCDVISNVYFHSAFVVAEEAAEP